MRCHRRGSIAIMTVVALGTVLGASLLSGEARVAPWARAQRAQLASDQARALAEAGVGLAQAALAADPECVGLEPVPLGEGRVEVTWTREADGVVCVRSVGTVSPLAPLRDQEHTRVVVVRLRLDDPATVLSWEDQ